MKNTILKTLSIAFTSLIIFTPHKASSQLLPQPWVSVGANDGDATFSVGARELDLGVELGRGPNGSTGVDVLKFLSLPVISPYIGAGWYSADKGFAYSGGVQVSASKNVFVGVGYNSVRGVNGQLGIKF